MKCDVGLFGKRVIAVLVALGPCAGWVFGEDSSSVPPDFRHGFEKLIAIGVPSAKEARYGHLEFQNDDSRNHQYREFQLKRKGNGWILPDTGKAEKARVAIQNGWQAVDVQLAKKKGLFGKLFGKRPSKDAKQARKATWKEIDPLIDAKSFTSQLEKLQDQGEAFSEDNWRYRTDGRDIGVDVLLFACHLYHAGHVAQANALASQILQAVPEPASLIDQIITKIADARMDKALQAFYQDQNWEEYLAKLKELQKDFPRGWVTGAGLEILIPAVEKRVSGSLPKITPIAGTELNPEIVQILDQLLVSKDPLVVQFYPLWLINPEGEIQTGYGRQVSAPWAQKILESGMNGLPTLIAYCSDETLLTGFPQEIRSGSRFRFSSRSSDTLDAFQVFQSMSRPKTRGEVVRHLLKSTIPDPDREFSSLDPEDFKVAVANWWRTNRAAEPGELAAQFLESRDYDALGVASRFLVHSENAEDHQRFETFILNSEYPVRHADLVERYVKKRKAQAKPFFEKYAAEISALNEDENFGQDPEAIVRRLSVHVEEIKAESLIAEIATGKRELKEALAQLASIIPEGQKKDILPDLLALAGKMQKPEEKMLILQTLAQWTNGEYHFAMEEGEEQGKQLMESLFSLLPKSREVWGQLLDDKQSLEMTSEELVTFGNPPSVSHYASRSLCSIYFPGNQREIRSLLYFMKQSELWEFYRKTGREILAKGAEVTIPSASQVDSARKGEIRADLRTKKVEEIFPYFRSLSLSEKFAWTEVLSGYDENVPQSVKEFSRVCGSIVTPFSTNVPAGLDEKLDEGFLGKQVQPELIYQALEILKSMAGGEKDFALFFSFGRSPVGNFLLQAWAPSSLSDWKRSHLEEELAQLSPEGSSALQGAIVYGLDDDRNFKKAVLYQKPIDAEAEQAGMKELLDQVMTVLRENQDEPDPSRKKQLSIILVHQNLADAKAETEE